MLGRQVIVAALFRFGPSFPANHYRGIPGGEGLLSTPIVLPGSRKHFYETTTRPGGSDF
jgi:hypothetical protein